MLQNKAQKNMLWGKHADFRIGHLCLGCAYNLPDGDM